MNLTKNIIYRGFTLNDEDIQSNVIGGNSIGAGISGSVLDSFNLNDVDIVQFMEKRSLEDGMDVGAVYKGARRVRITGTIYGVTRGLLYDLLMDLRAALDPVLAQADEPEDKGYQPLYFSIPTNRLDVYPTGYIDLRVLAMPRQFDADIQRDTVGGDEDDSLALPWQATLICRDPRIMGEEAQVYDLSDGGTVTGDLLNRGNHYAPLNMVMEVGTAAGTIAVQAGTSVFTITVPASTNSRIIRLKGADKILTMEELDVETTRMGSIAFSGDNTWPQVQPGTHSYSVVFTTVVPTAGSQMYFYESYA